MKLDKVTRLFLFTLAALLLYWLDSLITLSGCIPDGGLGLSLMVTLFVAWVCGVRESAVVTLVWIFLGAMVVDGFRNFLFSAAAGLVAFPVIAGLRYVLKENQVWIAGCMAAVTYGLAQLVLIIWLTDTVSYLLYFPMVIIYSVSAGLIMGLCVQLVIKRGKDKWKTIFK